MAEVIAGDRLKKAIESQSFVKNGRVESAEGIKYDFHLSNKILKAKYKRPIDTSSLSQTELAEMVIDPGEVVFALSEEKLELPTDTYAQLSPKRKMSEAGVLTLGGLVVNPGYKGYLLVGLLNYSSTPFTIRPGKKLIAATFYKLSVSEQVEYDSPSEDSVMDFPDKLVDVMGKYCPIGTKSLEESINKLKRDIESINRELEDRELWKKAIESHDHQIGGILKGLQEEIESRKTGHDALSKAMSDLANTFSTIKGAAFVVYGIFGLVLIPFMVQYFPKLLELFN